MMKRLAFSQNTAIGSNAGFTAGGFTNSTAIGYNTQVNASNKVVVGNTGVTSIGGYANWTNFSDGRYKRNIQENVPGLLFINKLKPVTYTIDVHAVENKLEGFTENKLKQKNAARDGSKMKDAIDEKSKVIYTGFVAQEVEKAAKSLHYDFSGVDKPKDENQSFYGLRYGDFVVPLVKAVQELSNENDELKKQNEALAARLDKIEQSLTQQNNTTISAAKESSQTVVLAAAPLLEQNIPNPFSNTTTIRYYLPVNTGNARINFYNVSGILLRSEKLQGSGYGNIQVKAKDLPAGTYQYSLLIDNNVISTKQMVQVK